MLERFKATPGVVCASMSQPGLFSHSTSQTVVIVDERTSVIYTIAVTPGFFRTLSIPLLRGRDFTALDRTTPPQVAIVNEAFARRFVHETDPVGQRILTGVGPGKLEIVGIVRGLPRRTVRLIQRERSDAGAVSIRSFAGSR
jgi:hypothetical protein